MTEDDARDAIYDRISQRAPEADGAELVKLADALERVAWGPHGGRMNNEYRYSGTVVNHYGDTARNGGRRAGFAVGDDSIPPPGSRPAG